MQAKKENEEEADIYFLTLWHKVSPDSGLGLFFVFWYYIIWVPASPPSPTFSCVWHWPTALLMCIRHVSVVFDQARKVNVGEGPLWAGLSENHKSAAGLWNKRPYLAINMQARHACNAGI